MSKPVRMDNETWVLIGVWGAMMACTLMQCVCIGLANFLAIAGAVAESR